MGFSEKEEIQVEKRSHSPSSAVIRAAKQGLEAVRTSLIDRAWGEALRGAKRRIRNAIIARSTNTAFLTPPRHSLGSPGSEEAGGRFHARSGSKNIADKESSRRSRF